MQIFKQIETALMTIDLKRHWVTFAISLLVVYWFVSFPLFSWVVAKFSAFNFLSGIEQLFGN